MMTAENKKCLVLDSDYDNAVSFEKSKYSTSAL